MTFGGFKRLILAEEDYITITPRYEFVAEGTEERYGEDVEIFLAYEDIGYIEFELSESTLTFARGEDTMLGVSISSYDRIRVVRG